MRPRYIDPIGRRATLSALALLRHAEAECAPMTTHARSRPRDRRGARAGSRSLRLLTLAGAACVLTLVIPSRASAQEQDPDEVERPSKPALALPPEDLPAPSVRYNLALTGVGITAGWYGAAVAASFMWPNGAWVSDVRIPIAGPWMAMPHFKCGPGEPNCGTALVIVRGVLAGMDGIGQVGGLAIALESLFLPVRKSNQARSVHTQHAWVRPVPILSGDTIGLGLVGAL